MKVEEVEDLGLLWLCLGIIVGAIWGAIGEIQPWFRGSDGGMASGRWSSDYDADSVALQWTVWLERTPTVWSVVGFSICVWVF